MPGQHRLSTPQVVPLPIWIGCAAQPQIKKRAQIKSLLETIYSSWMINYNRQMRRGISTALSNAKRVGELSTIMKLKRSEGTDSYSCFSCENRTHGNRG